MERVNPNRKQHPNQKDCFSGKYTGLSKLYAAHISTKKITFLLDIRRFVDLSITKDINQPRAIRN